MPRMDPAALGNQEVMDQDERPGSDEPDSGGILENPFDKDVPMLLALIAVSLRRRVEEQAARAVVVDE